MATRGIGRTEFKNVYYFHKLRETPGPLPQWCKWCDGEGEVLSTTENVRVCIQRLCQTCKGKGYHYGD